MNKIAYTLTPDNLATLGIYDEFYLLYDQIKQTYNDVFEIDTDDRIRCYDWDCDIKASYAKHEDTLLLNSVVKMCSPLFQKYSFLFWASEKTIYIKPKDFDEFSFSNIKKRPRKQTVKIERKTFSEFLCECQRIAAKNIHARILRDTPQLSKTYAEVFEEVLARTQELADLARADIEIADSTPVNTEVLYIFDALTSTSCYRNKHSVIAKRYVTELVSDAQKLSLPVHYCEDCARYFIGSKTLSLFSKNYGKMMLPTRPHDSIEYSKHTFSSFNDESKLHQLGYNVIEGLMADSEREFLLLRIIASGRLTYFDVCASIEQNIALFQHNPKYNSAVQKWKHDLKFLGKLIADAES